MWRKNEEIVNKVYDLVPYKIFSAFVKVLIQVIWALQEIIC